MIDFTGIRESHCPLVIGSLIKDAATTFFQGYLDNVSKSLLHSFIYYKNLIININY